MNIILPENLEVDNEIEQIESTSNIELCEINRCGACG